MVSESGVGNESPVVSGALLCEVLPTHYTIPPEGAKVEFYGVVPGTFLIAWYLELPAGLAAWYNRPWRSDWHVLRRSQDMGEGWRWR